MLRPRRPGDLPGLVEVLLDQQPETRYPLRDPLPFPVEEFLHATDAVAAWTAQIGDRLVGHGCHVGPRVDVPSACIPDEAAALAHGCDPGGLGWVSALFVASEVRGQGVGRRLLDVVVHDILERGRRPCLEVLPLHAAALDLYRRSGWRAVREYRPNWLRDTVGSDGPDVQVMVLSP